MNNWMITKLYVDENFQKEVKLNAGYVFHFSLPEDKYYYDLSSNSGIFIFGYYFYRLNATPVSGLNGLFNRLKEDASDSFHLIKGVYTIVVIRNGVFSVFNDPLGISKFYFSNDQTLYAGRLKYVKRHVDAALSRDHLLEYFVFNYSLNGRTFYKNINYSTPASCFRLMPDGKVRFSEYVDMVDYLSRPEYKLPKKEVFNHAVTTWDGIIQQLKSSLNENASLTLTAGLDSRIILGGFIKQGITNYNTFTFGNEQSSDVVYAKLLAEKLSIPHRHIYPDKLFFDNFKGHAAKIAELGDSLVSIYRAHRRSMGYDRLIVSDIAMHCWQQGLIESFLNDEMQSSKLSSLGFSSFDFILDQKDNYRYISHPMHYLFKVVIPLHFSQDVLMNMNMGWRTLLPFLDLDYLDFLKNTLYFDLNDYANYKRMNYRRRINGLYYSARLVRELNPALAAFSLGKGYSPDDITKSTLLFFLKAAIYKMINKNMHKQANFSFGKWYWSYLNKYFTENSLEEVGLNKLYLKEKLNKIQPSGGELHFLDFTKAINIHLAEIQ